MERGKGSQLRKRKKRKERKLEEQRARADKARALDKASSLTYLFVAVSIVGLVCYYAGLLVWAFAALGIWGAIWAFMIWKTFKYRSHPGVKFTHHTFWLILLHIAGLFLVDFLLWPFPVTPENRMWVGFTVSIGLGGLSGLVPHTPQLVKLLKEHRCLLPREHLRRIGWQFLLRVASLAFICTLTLLLNYLFNQQFDPNFTDQTRIDFGIYISLGWIAMLAPSGIKYMLRWWGCTHEPIPPQLRTGKSSNRRRWGKGKLKADLTASSFGDLLSWRIRARRGRP